MKLMEVKEVTIGDYNFYLKPFPAFTAANIMGDLASVLMPLLGALLPLTSGSGEDGTVLDMDVEKALPAVGAAFSSLDGDQFERVIRKLLVDSRNVTIEGEVTDGKPKIMTLDYANEAFCCDIWGMFRLCLEVIRLNYMGFFRKDQSQSGNPLESIVTMMTGSKDTEPSGTKASQNSN